MVGYKGNGKKFAPASTARQNGRITAPEREAGNMVVAVGRAEGAGRRYGAQSHLNITSNKTVSSYTREQRIGTAGTVTSGNEVHRTKRTCIRALLTQG